MNFDTEQFAVTLLQSMSEAVVYADAEGRIQVPGTRALNGSSVTRRPMRWVSHWTSSFPNRCVVGIGKDTARRCRPARRVMAPAISSRCRPFARMASRISIEFTVTPFHDQSGKILGIAAIMRDATKRFEEMKALRQRAAAASS